MFRAATRVWENVVILAIFASAGAATLARAQWTWDGGGANDNWSDAANWDNIIPPPNNGTADVLFDGLVRLTPVVNTAYSINSLGFNSGAGAFTLSGQALTLGAGGVSNSDDSLQTLAVPIVLAADQIWSANGGPLTFSGATVTGAGLDITVDGSASTIINAAISGTATAVIKAGSGTLTVGGANLYTGPTHVQAGILRLGNSNRIFNTSPLTISGGTFDLQGFGETLGPVVLESGSISGTGPLTGSSYSVWSGAIGAPLGGSAGLTKSTAGTVTLDGANSYTGLTSVQAGILRLGGSNRIANSSALTVSGGTFDVQSFNDTVAAVTLASGSISGTGTLTGSTFGVQSGTVDAPLGGNAGLTKSTAGTVTLNAANIYTGPTNVQAGILRLGASFRMPNTSPLIVSGGTFDLQGFSDSVAQVKLSSGAITGTGLLSGGVIDVHSGTITAHLSGGALTKSGAGMVVFSGIYTGNTAVNAGILQIDPVPDLPSANNINGGTVTIAGGATVRGTGNVKAEVTNGGTVAPGDSAGIMTFTPTFGAISYTQEAGGALNIEIGGTTVGTQYDRLVVAGSAVLNGTLNATLINGFVPSAGQQFVVMTYASSSGIFATVNLPTLPAGLCWTTDVGATSVMLTVLGDADGDGVADCQDTCVGSNGLIGQPCDDPADADDCASGVFECGSGTLTCTDGPAFDDPDSDGVLDCQDDCPGTAPGAFVGVSGCSCDQLGFGRSIVDTDGDTVPDDCDNCPDLPNAGQHDLNDDGVGDLCQFDSCNLSLRSWLPLDSFAGPPSRGNSCWGYVSPGGQEYALMGLENQIAVVRITDPANPIIVGSVPHTPSRWADVRAYGHYAYACNESGGGLDVIDLSQVDNDVVVLVQRVTQNGLATSHTLDVNPISGYLYLAGANINNGCLVAMSLADPANPTIAGQWGSAQACVYSHELHVVTYDFGPHAGKELAFCFNQHLGFRVVDVTNKGNIIPFSPSIGYQGVTYCHQGWTDPTRTYLYVNDEISEGLQTLVFNISNPAAPTLVTSFSGSIQTTDHNIYWHEGFLFESNYKSGLRIFDMDNPVSPTEVGYFDTYPEDNTYGYQGAWNNHPFLPSGTVIVSDIDRGLFVLDASEALAPTPTYVFPDSRPDLVDAAGGTRVRVIISGTGAAAPQPGTGVLRFNRGAGEETVPMEQVSPTEYEAVFAGAVCGSEVTYHVSAELLAGGVGDDPRCGAYSAWAASPLPAVFEDDMEIDRGWTTGPDTTGGGTWVRGDPNPTVGQPGDDHTPGAGVNCRFTGATANVNVGTVRINSPTFDLSGSDALVTYWRWYYESNREDDPADGFIAEISNDNGSSWNTIESLSPHALGWRQVRFRVSDLLVPTGQMKLRFSATDGPGPAEIIEAAIDDVVVSPLQCTPQDADIDGDGDVDLADQEVLNSCMTSEGDCPCFPALYADDSACYGADANMDGDVDLADYANLQDAF